MGMKKLFAEFKAFAFKGNMIDLAVAVVIGTVSCHQGLVTIGGPRGIGRYIRDLATGLVGLYLGLELITQLRGDRRPVDALFESVGRLLSAVTALRSGSPSRVR